MAGAAAFPCDEEVPMMIGSCCLICYPSFGCARKLGVIKGGGDGGEGGEAVG